MTKNNYAPFGMNYAIEAYRKNALDESAPEGHTGLVAKVNDSLIAVPQAPEIRASRIEEPSPDSFRQLYHKKKFL